MLKSEDPRRQKQVVLIGGGHTHALVLHALNTHPLENAEIIVINPGTTAPYSGMLPGFVAGHYRRSELDIDLTRLCTKVGAHFIDGLAIGLNDETKRVLLKDGSDIAYDIASFDVGITSTMTDLPGFNEHAVPAKPLGHFATQWDAYRAEQGEKAVAIIGGGIAGAELAMAMSFALRNSTPAAEVKLLDRGTILSANSSTAQKHVRAELKRNQVAIFEHADVTAVTQDGVILDDGSKIVANFIVGAAGATPHPWITQTGLTLQNGFVEVDKTLLSSTPNVFAVGDCAHLRFDPRPKAGVYAVRQAPILLENIRKVLASQPLREYKPQSDYLKLVSLGGKRAFGEKFGRSLSGRLVWRVKDYIDQSFMKQF